VSVDTGPAHVAAALGIPLAVLYGAESPSYWLPRTPSGSPTLGVGGPPNSNRADQVSVDAVFDAWLTVVQQAEGESGMPLARAGARQGP
jgi:ADP-heptose:LPS heptosyltransferase